MDNIANRLKRLAKAIAYHDLAYGDALENPENPLKVGDNSPNTTDQLRLWEVGEEIERLAKDIQMCADWKELRDAVWDLDAFNKYIKYQIIEDIASEPQTRLIKLPSILAESEFDELLDIVKMKYPTTEIYGSDIWRH